jgi:hypothetical protein
MNDQARIRYLKLALVIIGVTFIVGIYALTVLWPAGWMWEPRQAEYEQMILGIYATLGVFLLLASRDPLAHRSLIWFTIWSSLVHGGIMLVQAVVDETEQANLLGDIPALFMVALVLWFLMPKRGVQTAGS